VTGETASVKQQLLDSFRAELDELEQKAESVRWVIRDLERRGSGPLPAHYGIAALRRGISVELRRQA
jgi:hypothetical protein